MPIGYMFPGTDQLDEQTRRALLAQAAVSMGSKMLQAGGQGQNTAAALGQGLEAGLGSLTRSQQVAMENAMRRQQMEMQQAQEDRAQEKYENERERQARLQERLFSTQPQGKESSQGTMPGAPTPGSMTPQGIIPQMRQGQFQPSQQTAAELAAMGMPATSAAMFAPSTDRMSASDLVEVQMADGTTRYVPAGQAPGLQAPPEGRWTMSTPDAYGTRYWYHTGTAERERVGGPQTGTQPQGDAGPVTPGVDIGEATPKAVGPISNIRAFMNNAFGWMKPGGTFFPEEADARQQARIFRQQTMGLLSHETSRLSNWEQQQVRDLLPNPERFFQDPDAALNDLYRLRGFIQQKIQMNQQAMQSLPQKEALEMQVANERLQQALQMIDPPTPDYGQMSQDDLRRYAEGLSSEAINAMSEAERQALIQALEENDL